MHQTYARQSKQCRGGNLQTLKVERPETNSLTLQLQELEKEQTKPIVSRRKGIRLEQRWRTEKQQRSENGDTLSDFTEKRIMSTMSDCTTANRITEMKCTNPLTHKPTKTKLKKQKICKCGD